MTRRVAAAALWMAGCVAGPPAIATQLPAPMPATAPPRIERLSLDGALALARTWRLESRVAEARTAAGRGRVFQAGRWANPRVEVESEDGDTGRYGGLNADATYRASVGWELPLSGRPRTRAEALAHDVRRLEAETGAARRAVEREVREAFARALAAEMVERQATAAIELAAAGREVAQARRTAGLAIEPELMRADIEESRARAAQERAAGVVQTARVAVTTAIGLPGLEIGGLDGAIPETWPAVDRGRATAQALARAPGIGVAEATLEVARAGVAAAEAEGRPDPELRLGVATFRDNGRRLAFEWGVGLALPFLDRNLGGIAEAQARVAEAEAELVRVRNGVVGEVRALLAAYASLRGRLARYTDNLVPAAERHLALVRAGFPGQLGRLELLDAQRTVLDLRAERAEVVAETAVVAAQLEGLAGVPLDTLK